MEEKTNNVTPKYACRSCDSVLLRGQFHTQQVFQARGDEIIHVEAENFGIGRLHLSCLNCGEEIEAWPKDEFPME